jgi:hypothetical protein
VSAAGESWRPANDTERAMMRAAAEGDRREYFRIAATADLYLPQILGDTDGEQRFVTATMFDQTFLLVFTSVEAMTLQVGDVADAYAVTSYSELRQKWPEPNWRLAVNPGSPLDAYVPIDAVAAAAGGEVLVPTMAEVVAEAAEDQDMATRAAVGSSRAAVAAGGDVDVALFVAAEAGDVGGYVATLLDALVLVLTERDVVDPNEILEPDFPWRRVGPPGQPMVEVFTSADALARAHPALPPTVTVGLPFALARWPQRCGISVNPGSPSALELSEDQVLWLLMWDRGDDDADD